uniref:V-type proton ATPase subunit F n=1 Tax=Drosophila melanogaster TaxID=7227 RepID=A0A0B4K626_DROME|nr:vacuolar H[+] ATPase 14kD subunit 2, isoform B [Drosophila melanogaster]NP_001246944.1 vacuolar H[+] ATPase 14kD subunit 2, isoform C [Drosophila melanogaster]AFH06262.1 vacuolar H[+] ATPase 14kD subunit 2, isoform B [Drosophila melanogaster]AFH06263.1 vacuolar H[+] ATPase 14kD subunit 2, isoform C [Drosophila melanogaster]|eukprot:NP_001246943.1 vacuolar H[+] ATPase 14kD subunit 2, isoform B [Drosophila melanogaster]
MSSHTEDLGRLLAVIGDEDTCVGFLLGGIGEVDEDRETNFMVVERDTTPKQIEECFKKFLRRPDIVIILINQVYADMIRPTVDAHNLAVPTVLEIPSKQHPYDSSRDSILKRAQRVITPPERHY